MEVIFRLEVPPSATLIFTNKFECAEEPTKLSARTAGLAAFAAVRSSFANAWADWADGPGALPVFFLVLILTGAVDDRFRFLCFLV